MQYHSKAIHLAELWHFLHCSFIGLLPSSNLARVVAWSFWLGSQFKLRFRDFVCLHLSQVAYSTCGYSWRDGTGLCPLNEVSLLLLIYTNYSIFICYYLHRPMAASEPYDNKRPYNAIISSCQPYKFMTPSYSYGGDEKRKREKQAVSPICLQ